MYKDADLSSQKTRQVMKILICYYKQKDKKTAQEGPGRPSTYNLEQLCSSMSTQDTITLEVWSNGCFHLHSTDTSAHPLNYKEIHERRDFIVLGLPA